MVSFKRKELCPHQFNALSSPSISFPSSTSSFSSAPWSGSDSWQSIWSERRTNGGRPKRNYTSVIVICPTLLSLCLSYSEGKRGIPSVLFFNVVQDDFSGRIWSVQTKRAKSFIQINRPMAHTPMSTCIGTRLSNPEVFFQIKDIFLWILQCRKNIKSWTRISWPIFSRRTPISPTTSWGWDQQLLLTITSPTPPEVTP